MKRKKVLLDLLIIIPLLFILVMINPVKSHATAYRPPLHVTYMNYNHYLTKQNMINQQRRRNAVYIDHINVNQNAPKWLALAEHQYPYFIHNYLKYKSYIKGDNLNDIYASAIPPHESAYSSNLQSRYDKLERNYFWHRPAKERRWLQKMVSYVPQRVIQHSIYSRCGQYIDNRYTVGSLKVHYYKNETAHFTSSWAYKISYRQAKKDFILYTWF